ncbi:MAG TPA: DUF2752 domain-containing protein [Flavobacterium sp.]|nr:DUF2752 domain-containing protein [Flavobacterium sp.]
MTKRKLYSLLLILCTVGYLYLIYNSFFLKKFIITPCIFKNVTGYACPSCGTTRSVNLFLQGEIIQSFLINPLGIIVALMMIVFPLWILWDIILKKDSFFKMFQKAEKIIQKPWLAIVLIVLIILNWVWNIKKQL